MRGRAICGCQKQNQHRLVIPIKLIKSDVELFTNKADGRKWGRTYNQQRKIVANRVFERGYREYLKSLKKGGGGAL